MNTPGPSLTSSSLPTLAIILRWQASSYKSHCKTQAPAKKSKTESLFGRRGPPPHRQSVPLNRVKPRYHKPSRKDSQQTKRPLRAERLEHGDTKVDSRSLYRKTGYQPCRRSGRGLSRVQVCPDSRISVSASRRKDECGVMWCICNSPRM